MSQSTLLAHVVAKFSPRQWENVASESLRYLLQRPGAAGVMADLLSPVTFSGEVSTWEGQVYGDDAGIPDLVGADRHRRPVLIVEAKFQALLTEHQPETYLVRQGLAFDGDVDAHLMVFLVPERRRQLLVAEVARRLDSRRQDVGGHRLLTDQEGRRVVVASWGQLLRRLKEAFEDAGDEQALQDLGQLGGLCARAETESMMPLAAEDVSSEHGLRYWQFCDVLEAVVRQLESEGTVSRKRLTQTALKGVWGLYFRAGQQEMALAVLAWSWAYKASTPWWVRISDPTGRVLELLEPLRADPGVLHLVREDGSVKLGLTPVLGVEQEILVAALAGTVRACSALLSGEAEAAGEGHADLGDAAIGREDRDPEQPQ